MDRALWEPMRRPRLTHEESVSIVRERLNRTAGVDPTKAWLLKFAIDCIDVLDGDVGTLTPEETERIRAWREL